VADGGLRIVCGMVAGAAGLIRIEEVWMAVEPLDMRAGTDTALARVVSVFGYARAHHAYLFANKRVSRMKVLVHDGFGFWLCARRLHKGGFVWAQSHRGAKITMTMEQLDALVVGLPWQQIADLATIRVI
jgi:transposase